MPKVARRLTGNQTKAPKEMAFNLLLLISDILSEYPRRQKIRIKRCDECRLLERLILKTELKRRIDAIMGLFRVI